MAITNLHLASDIPIKNALVGLKAIYSSHNSWVAPTNRYVNDTLTRVRQDLTAGTVVNNDMVDYIAASSIIHCFNSWSYLTSAINSYLEGDYGNAVHNAYYSQLRSIMSFLASQGIGVFNGFNVIIDQHGVAHEATSPKSKEKATHNFAKISFDQWLSAPANTGKLLTLLKVKDIPLVNWFNEAGFSTLIAGTKASNFLSNWSLDINTLKAEHDLRNFVSYRPQSFDQSIVRPSDDIKQRLQIVFNIWELCAPGRLFDISILRRSLDDLNFAAHAQKYSTESEANIQAMLTRLGMNPLDHNGRYIVNFFRRNINVIDNDLFDKAANTISANPIIEADTDPIGILSRSCLLLLTNTNINENLLKAAATSRADLDFWYDNIGIKLGYWELGDAPMLFSDMYEDVHDEMVEIKKWINPANAQSIHSFKKDLKSHSTHIRQLNKSYFWNTGS